MNAAGGVDSQLDEVVSLSFGGKIEQTNKHTRESYWEDTDKYEEKISYKADAKETIEKTQNRQVEGDADAGPMPDSTFPLRSGSWIRQGRATTP
jgi:hypothetical protein